MITDRELVQDDNVLLTVTRNSTDVLDLASNANVARGLPLRARLQVGAVALTSGGATTLQSQLVTADDAALTTNVTVLLDTGVIAKASLVSGYIAMDRVIPLTKQRYLGWIHTVATGPFTAGGLTAEVVIDTETPMSARPTNYVTGL